ncbi:hypothetical protein [Occallatibacter riparius]|uniref:Uncharacterized protein n=1 Tax=Occallatibacter riparius TaxID=1002689 RepID=A0A9J7BQ65_9BACT|nr:hypothetical protein [Occallatibacter riparius]UWZ85020.1 hypothetical protein MOP44_03530 [Occallatibacter riparius]
MRRRRLLRPVWFLAVLLPVTLLSQSAPPGAQQVAPIPMPSDRASDSYLIYSSLMPLGETVGAGWPHDLWLVQDTTVLAVPLDQPCRERPTANAGHDWGMNPHNGVHPPKAREQDFKEILQDFDAHCHEVLSLSATAWQTTVPVHLLTPTEQAEFQNTRWEKADEAARAKYKGAPALYGFSEVYFNEHHTVALVYATHWCGGLCGEGFWIAFALENGQWKRQNWAAMRWIS